MKRVLYTIPAVIICVIYGMLTLLAGGFAALQMRAWVMILLPVLSAVLLVKGNWWGCLPGMCLGGLIAVMFGTSRIALVLGAVVLVYYLAMGIFSLKDTKKKNT